MFRSARIRLTLWYLVIIAVITGLFSFAIYNMLSHEIGRIVRVETIRSGNLPFFPEAIFTLTPTQIQQMIDEENRVIEESEKRLALAIVAIDFAVIAASGFAGYFLAGRTLLPIENMMEEQKRFTADASHELRTPLSALKSEIEVSLRDKKMKIVEAREVLTSNLEEVNKIQSLANYLLTLNKYQANSSSFPFSKVNLADVAAIAIKRVLPLLDTKNITIEKKLNKVYVEANKESLVELTVILLDNAIKYSSNNSKIIVRTAKAANHSVLEVKDFGRGMREKDIPHIFDRFYRADASRSKEKVDGYGLGLSIAKNIVDLHKGKIEVKSKISEGSTFRVVI
ncbi:MAG TPA: HAMP domain-containing sensor histidine kinase [Patescibacteria group bacterium]